MMIDHMALWTADLERSRGFYEDGFEARAGARYQNPRTGFASYFLQFAGGSRLELMQRPDVQAAPPAAAAPWLGYAHLAVQAGDRAAVDSLTHRLRAAGHPVVGEPRTTGDGYYESVVLDPDGNRIEIVAAGTASAGA